MTRITPAFIMLGCLAVGPATALAMQPYLPASPKTFNKADVDSNGKITSAELAPKAGRRFARLDADSNGQVTLAEIDAALQKALERRKARMLETLDANKDSQISRAELDAAVDRLIAAADADHDGGVTMEEVRSYRLVKSGKPATEKSAN
jgi:Ca2+-binding EF-hand superfamily protein